MCETERQSACVSVRERERARVRVCAHTRMCETVPGTEELVVSDSMSPGCGGCCVFVISNIF